MKKTACILALIFVMAGMSFPENFFSNNGNYKFEDIEGMKKPSKLRIQFFKTQSGMELLRVADVSTKDFKLHVRSLAITYLYDAERFCQTKSTKFKCNSKKIISEWKKLSINKLLRFFNADGGLA